MGKGLDDFLGWFFGVFVIVGFFVIIGFGYLLFEMIIIILLFYEGEFGVFFGKGIEW